MDHDILQFAIDNRDWLGFVVMHGGNAAVTVARVLFEAVSPLLQQFFSEYPH
ncbi:hypothetical protein IU449_25300 [Nocardia higoensis]|uniref:Uncharacterized protein n=1 Tax=Nocardia higoensis TaxID=228599 RepID=A0ABS0DH75_9NOCA|nr:hypothetical protein [Nocardia higoensis]MBF6357818.1 hypothetical protein [Nocardia higoensis]